jgi:hypothetical protein
MLDRAGYEALEEDHTHAAHVDDRLTRRPDAVEEICIMREGVVETRATTLHATVFEAEGLARLVADRSYGGTQPARNIDLSDIINEFARQARAAAHRPAPRTPLSPARNLPKTCQENPPTCRGPAFRQPISCQAPAVGLPHPCRQPARTCQNLPRPERRRLHAAPARLRAVT